ncbi:hypothetical protein [Kitasatospora sp. NPDC059571]|uniref:hypothetical protein n=1 Tax=Kitasatospora sp. NPDC059571 TaxID=3346871 RepID=UPI0036AC034A
MSDRHTPGNGPLLLRLYPARYRAAHGEDIAATLAEATEGLSRPDRLREHLDLASHALRLRLRIGATDPAGRMLAGAAPVVLGLLAGFCLWGLVPDVLLLVHRILRHQPHAGPVYLFYSAAANLPWILALTAVAVGRWRLARALGLAGTLLGAGSWVVFGPMTVMILFGQPMFWVVLGAVVLLAPPSLLDRSLRTGWEATAVGLPFAALLVASQSTGLWVYFTGSAVLHVYVSWPLLATAAVLLGHLVAEHRDPYRATGAGLTGLLWLLPGLLDDSRPRMLTTWAAGYLALVAFTVALATAVRTIRRTRAKEPADPA